MAPSGREQKQRTAVAHTFTPAAFHLSLFISISLFLSPTLNGYCIAYFWKLRPSGSQALSTSWVQPMSNEWFVMAREVTWRLIGPFPGGRVCAVGTRGGRW